MKMTKLKKVLSFIICIVLIAALALLTTGCNNNKTKEDNQSSQTADLETTKIGSGKTSFLFTVTDKDGKQTAFTVSTDKKIVGDALLENNLIKGDKGDFGLYVKTVNGITLDYDKDGKYWAFYENGKYASKGVDLTEIKPDVTYGFKAE